MVQPDAPFRFSTDPYVAENQMRAIIQHLVAFAYIDAEFDPAERTFIRGFIDKLVEQRAARLQAVDPEIIAKWSKHFHEVLDEVDRRIQSLFQESVADGETTQQFVLSRLKLGCFELLKRFDEAGQKAVLAAVEELMHADGVVHENEEAFLRALTELVLVPEQIDEADIEQVSEGEVIIGQPRRQRVTMTNHPFLSQHEWDFSRDRAIFEQQSRGDMDLVAQVMEILQQQRAAGQGGLVGAKDFSDIAPGRQFLDGHIWVLSPRPEQDYELLVLGDLHGCYSCLKAALMQVDFFAKAQAHADDPEKNPPICLVFLGDYIDRGRFSLSGTLRTTLQLFAKMPQTVFPLRGNHEYFVELDGRVLAPVRPCEAMDSISAVAETEVFSTYMRLFDSMPNILVFGDLLFVHGGIPRQDTLEERFGDLSSLNDYDLRFQMMWSDPSQVEEVPLDLQQASARFPFGQRQFQQFMTRVGCRVMIRGHEVIDEGFRTVYDDASAKLLTLFSAGGASNDDLPADSYLRDVTPMALSIHRREGVSSITPFEIDYSRFNDPELNAFFKKKLQG